MNNNYSKQEFFNAMFGFEDKVNSPKENSKEISPKNVSSKQNSLKVDSPKEKSPKQSSPKEVSPKQNSFKESPSINSAASSQNEIHLCTTELQVFNRLLDCQQLNNSFNCVFSVKLLYNNMKFSLGNKTSEISFKVYTSTTKVLYSYHIVKLFSNMIICEVGILSGRQLGIDEIASIVEKTNALKKFNESIKELERITLM